MEASEVIRLPSQIIHFMDGIFATSLEYPHEYGKPKMEKEELENVHSSQSMFLVICIDCIEIMSSFMRFLPSSHH